MLDDNITQTLAIIIPILGAIFSMYYFLTRQINTAEKQLSDRIDLVEKRLDGRIDGVEKAVREDFVEVRRDLTRVREDLAEVKGKVDLMAAIVTKSENERMAEAIIALETRRTSAQSE